MIIWEFLDYRQYLHQRMGSYRSRTGLRKRLAQAIPVHSTFVSQVLLGKNDFSLEQAEAVNLFFEHTEDEGEYFILLILKDRAGHSTLKKRFEKKINKMRDQRLNIKARLKVQNSTSDKDREKYYSNSIHSAIHVLCSIPQFQTIDALAYALKLSKSKINNMVDFLIQLGILNQNKEKIFSVENHIHLGNEDELILKHHINWRQNSINSLQFINPDDIHYSGCFSVSHNDVFKIKESILENLQKNIGTISKSKEEVAFVLNIDFYKYLQD